MVTDAPRDLTTERAAKQYTMNDLFKLAMEGKVNIVEDRFVSAAALKTARQEAMREAAKVVRDWPWEQPLVHADPLRQARCRGNREASVDIADALDRLASEG